MGEWAGDVTWRGLLWAALSPGRGQRCEVDSGRPRGVVLVIVVRATLRPSGAVNKKVT